MCSEREHNEQRNPGDCDCHFQCNYLFTFFSRCFDRLIKLNAFSVYELTVISTAFLMKSLCATYTHRIDQTTWVFVREHWKHTLRASARLGHRDACALFKYYVRASARLIYVGSRVASTIDEAKMKHPSTSRNIIGECNSKCMIKIRWIEMMRVCTANGSSNQPRRP